MMCARSAILGWATARVEFRFHFGLAINFPTIGDLPLSRKAWRVACIAQINLLGYR